MRCAWLLLAAASAVRAAAPAWTPPFVRMADLMIAHDVTVDTPYAGGAYPFLMVGLVSQLDNAAACPPKKYDVTAAYKATGASMAFDELIGYTCASSGLPGALPASTAATAPAFTTDVPISDLFVESGLQPETQFRTDSPAPTGHYHYDWAQTVKGAALYSDECRRRTGSVVYCAAPAYALPPGNGSLAWPAAPQRQPDTRRVHISKLVPFMSFPSNARVTYHLQYRAPQLAVDFPTRVNATRIVDDAGATLGYAYAYAITLGAVNAQTITATETHHYELRLLTESRTAHFESQSLLVDAPSASHAIDIERFSTRPAVYSADGTRARMELEFTLRITARGYASGVVVALPTQAGGSVVASAVTATSCVPLTLVSVRPGALANRNTTRYCDSATACTYLMRWTTDEIALSADGRAFIDTVSSDCTPGVYAFSVARAQCTRLAGGSVASPCTPSVAMSSRDTVTQRVLKLVSPTFAAARTLQAGAYIVPAAQPSVTDLERAACTPDCAVTSGQLSTHVAFLFAWTERAYWTGASRAPTLMLDADTLSIRVLGFAVVATTPTRNDIVQFTRDISRDTLGAAAWADFRAAWRFAPRNVTTPGAARCALLTTLPGTDCLVLSTSVLYAQLRALGLHTPYVVRTLMITAYVVPYAVKFADGTARSLVAAPLRVSLATARDPQLVYATFAMNDGPRVPAGTPVCALALHAMALGAWACAWFVFSMAWLHRVSSDRSRAVKDVESAGTPRTRVRLIKRATPNTPRRRIVVRRL
jgi:hypothetical protein